MRMQIIGLLVSPRFVVESIKCDIFLGSNVFGREIGVPDRETFFAAKKIQF